MEDQNSGKIITGSMVYNELPDNFKKILDKACYAAFKQGYSEGYHDGKTGAEDHSQSEEQQEPADLRTGKKWKGKESQSWKWV
jgi:hypothetical protein